MTFDSMLAAQVREVFEEFPEIEEKRMFGGVGFLANGNMACGVLKDDLIVRVGPLGWAHHQALRQWVLNGLEFALTLPKK